MGVMNDKLNNLIQILRESAPLLIAYSGGIDSALLAALAKEYAGSDQISCVLIDGPEVPRRAFHEAIKIAESLHLPLEVVTENLLSEIIMKNNPPDRCRHCKCGFFKILEQKAKEYGGHSIADGANASDLLEYRPGIDEMSACGVIHPFIMAGITKQDIRLIAREKGFSFWNKPSSACLYSRIPYGEEITSEKLRMIEQGEDALADLGITQGRVRHHGTIARIEVPLPEMNIVFTNREKVVELFRFIGFHYITLDLQGYRPGSMDEMLKQ